MITSPCRYCMSESRFAASDFGARTLSEIVVGCKLVWMRQETNIYYVFRALRKGRCRYPSAMPSGRFSLVAFDLDNTLVDRDAAFLAGLKAWIESCVDVSEDRVDLLGRILELDRHGYKPRSEFCREAAMLFDGNLSAATAMWDGVRMAMVSAI